MATLLREGREHLSNPTLAGWGALGDAGSVSQVYPALAGASEERTPHTPFPESSPLRSLPYLPGGVPVPTQAAWGPAGLAWAWAGEKTQPPGPTPTGVIGTQGF